MDQHNTSSVATPAAQLDTEVARQYRAAVGHVQDAARLADSIEQARGEVHEIVRSLDESRAAMWRAICATHNLDPDANYAVDEHGGVIQDAGSGSQ